MAAANLTRGVMSLPSVDLSATLGRLRLPNPVLTASGTFGYAREMEGVIDLSRLGGVVPKSVTREPRPGNRPWRTLETAGGMLNSIGLDNDGVDYFVARHLPYLASLGPPVVVSIAGKSADDFVAVAQRIDAAGGAAALELNVSCPNVSGGIDFGTDPDRCREVVSAVRGAVDLPLLAKLTPNVTRIEAIAAAAEEAGADGVTLINTVSGMAVDWRRRRPVLGGCYGGLSGPAIKPIALRCVHRTAAACGLPIAASGGIETIDDAMEFFVAGASAVQIGTANFYRPTAAIEILDALPAAVASLGAIALCDVVGSMHESAPAS